MSPPVARHESDRAQRMTRSRGADDVVMTRFDPFRSRPNQANVRQKIWSGEIAGKEKQSFVKTPFLKLFFPKYREGRRRCQYTSWGYLFLSLFPLP